MVETEVIRASSLMPSVVESKEKPSALLGYPSSGAIHVLLSGPTEADSGPQ